MRNIQSFIVDSVIGSYLSKLAKICHSGLEKKILSITYSKILRQTQVVNTSPGVTQSFFKICIYIFFENLTVKHSTCLGSTEVLPFVLI